MDRQELLAALLKLARVIPKFAPDFTDQLTANAWVSALERERWQKKDFYRAVTEAIRVCDSFPSIARLIEIEGGARADPKALAQTLADEIWVLLGRYSAHYAPERLYGILNEAQRAAVPSVAAAKALSTLLETDRTTAIAQWRTAIQGYLESPRGREMLMIYGGNYESERGKTLGNDCNPARLSGDGS